MIATATSKPAHPRRTRLTAGSGALFAALSLTALSTIACSPLQHRTGEALVTTASGEPIAGATVRADPIDPRHPLNISDYIRPTPDTLGIWQTDAAGHAPLILLLNRPTELTIVKPGYLPASRFIDAGDSAAPRIQLEPAPSGR